MAEVGIIGAGRLSAAVQSGLQDLHDARVIADSSGFRNCDLVDAVVDASRPAGAAETVRICAEYGVGLVYCVSEVPAGTLEKLHNLSHRVPVVLAPNLSRMHWLQMRLVAQMRDVTDMYTTEVIDRHPTTKQPLASRTAQMLSKAAGAPSTITIIRDGQPVSDHTVGIRSAHESLTIAHSVRSLEAVRDGIRIAVSHVLGGQAGITKMSELFELEAEENNGK